VTATLVRSPHLGDDVIGHLDAQIASARRLLSAVLRQGQSIRAREVEEVMARLADIQAEMGRRAALEGTRTAILTTAGAALGVPPHTVTIESLAQLLVPVHATAALQRSAELRGLLGEIVREHAINRVLMRQELAFLDHLMRELGAEPDTGYGALAGGAAAHAPARGPQASFRTLDLQA
jgi:FlgN protein